MDNYLYLLIIIGLTIFMLFYGGHNKLNIIEYNSDYFNNLNTIIIFEKKLNKNLQNINFNTDFINIKEFHETFNILIPNFINSYYIRIKPFTLFNIFNLIENKDFQNIMMIIFNHKEYNNLELLIGDTNNIIFNDNLKELNSNIKIGYFYNLKKKISITGIYHIYNNSNNTVIITCFIIKKPFWHN